MGGFKRPPTLTFVVHGEPSSAEALRAKIEARLGWKAVIPEYKEEFRI
jgi:metallo-beta-lactamase family protein